MTKTDNDNAVGDAIRLVATELRPWMEERLGVWPPDSRGEVAPYDPYYLVTVLRERWLSDFSREFGTDGHILVADFRHMRNRWAHNVPFDDEDTARAIDSCRRILAAIGSSALMDLQGVEDTIQSEVPSSPEAERLPTAVDRHRGHRRMRSSQFRDDQWSHRFDPHVAPVNNLVDQLIERRDGSWMPYVAPHHGGVEAEMVLLFQDPGKMTSLQYGGSGFISCENDDPTAETLAECLDAAGVSQERVTPWNAYPWFLADQGGLTVGLVEQGLQPLRQVLQAMRSAHTVVTGGTKAGDSWGRFATRFPEEAARWRHVPTLNTSTRGITRGGRHKKPEGVESVVAALRLASSPP